MSVDGSGGGDGGGGSGGGALGGAALGSARAACGRANHIQRRVRSRALRRCCDDALARPLQRQHPAAWYFFSATRLPACSVELNALDRAHGLSFRRGLVKRKTSNSRWLATTALGPSPSSSSISAMRMPWPWPVLAFWKTEVACSGGVLAVADDACLHGRRGDESEGLQPLVVLSPKHEETAGALRLARGFLVDDRNHELLETGGFVDVSPRHVTCPAANELPSAPQPKTLRRAQFGNNCAYRRWRQLVEVKFCPRLSWRPGVIRRVRRVRRVRRRNLGLNELCLCVELGAESPESSGDGFVVGYERR